MLCTITEAENAEIMKLNLRKETLCELFITLSRSTNVDTTCMLYEKLCADMDSIKSSIMAWWIELVKKYNLEPKEGYQWHIDHETRIVTLVKIV